MSDPGKMEVRSKNFLLLLLYEKILALFENQARMCAHNTSKWKAIVNHARVAGMNQFCYQVLMQEYRK